MTAKIHLLLDYAIGSLPRLIGLVERRGFDITELALDGAGDERRIALSVRARDAGRSFEVLQRQIDRLHGLRRIDGGAETPSQIF